MALKHRYLLLTLLSLITITLAFSLSASGSRANAHRQSALIKLQSSGVIDRANPVSALSTSEDGHTLYTVDGFTGEVDAYGSDPSGALSYRGKATGAVRGPHGYGAGADKDQKITVWDAAGRVVSNFKTYPADSLAFLGGGNLVVASPANGHFLHVYGQQGRLLRSFGTLKTFDRDEGENQFLHRGKVLVDAADNIYYVYHYIPLIEKYAPDGALLYEIQVTGAAVDVQQRVAERFFSNRQAAQVGGIHILSAAALDRRTGHLWVGMNGSSNTAVIYEYNELGEKLREYALETDSSARQRITGISDIAITDSNLYVLTALHQVHSFSPARGSSARALSAGNHRRD